MAELRLLPLGVGNAFSELHYSTSLALIAADDRWLLVDCPHPIRKILREASLVSSIDLNLSRLVGVALTHLHADHASGLEGLGYYYKYVLRSSQPPSLYTESKVLEALWPRPEAELFNLIAVADACQAGPFQLDARIVTHGDLAACAFRIGCGGRAVGHSGDTIFDPELVRWLAAADLVVHEAGAEEEPSRHHTAYRQLATLPGELRQKMRLAHYADDFDLDSCIIEPLRVGQVYAV
jgi:ribonuclease BN (tRNA processing enzyme)